MDDSQWSSTLISSIQTWQNEIRALQFEHRAKEKLAIIAQTPHLKAGRYSKKIRDASGKPIDICQSVVNESLTRMAQLEIQIQEKEILIAQAEDELMDIGKPSDDDNPDDDTDNVSNILGEGMDGQAPGTIPGCDVAPDTEL